MFCLPRFAAEYFKQKLKDGSIDPEKLMDMTSKERRAFFEGIVGKENAAQVNASFEKGMIAKNQQDAMIKWAKEITGIKPEVRNDLLSKILKTRNIGKKGNPIGPVPLAELLEPEELDMFLEDLAATRLGVSVTAEEARTISNLAKDVATKKEKMLSDFTFPTEKDMMDYGYAQIDFIDYVADLKEQAGTRSIKEIAKDAANPAKLGETLTEFGSFAKSLKASLDNSSLLNQGIPVLWAHNGVWRKNSFQSFKDIWETFGGKNVMRQIRAQIAARPNALNGTYKKMKLGVGVTEEAFPSSLPERIPGVGRAFRAAENAFTGFNYRNRADVADIYMRTLQKMGEDTTDKTRLESWGKMINSLTGRGGLGKAEPAAGFFNKLFFSARFFKSHIDVLTHPFTGAGGDAFVRKQAGKNLLKMIIGTAIILAIAKALDPDAVDNDPRGTHFGKVKIFGHWTDITGGMGSLLTLAARIGTLSSKSSTTGEINPLNSGKFGATDGWDLVNDYFGNKLSPLAGIVRDYLKGVDPSGNKFTFGNEVINLLAPIPATSVRDLSSDPNKADMLGAIILNTLGANVSSYAPSPGSLVADDKPDVVEEVFTKMATGDTEGAQQLAHEFNDRLKETIKDDLVKKTPDIDPNELETKVDSKWKKDGIYLPTASEVEKFKAGDTKVVASVTANGKPVIVKETAIPSQGIIGTVVTYAQAIGTDPVTAFNDIFKGQTIRQVTNGTVIVYRMSLSASQKVKTDRGGNTPDMKLDHTVPLELGGNNEEGNLKLVTTAEWEKYSPVENYLGTALKEKRANRKQVQEAIIGFKNGTISFSEIKKLYPE